MNGPLLSPAQLATINAAAATLRRTSREAFLYDIKQYLTQLGHRPSNAEVTQAIHSALGVTPAREEAFKNWKEHTHAVL